MEIPLICGNASVVFLDKMGRCALVTNKDDIMSQTRMNSLLVHLESSKRVIVQHYALYVDYFLGLWGKKPNVKPSAKDNRIRIWLLSL